MYLYKHIVRPCVGAVSIKGYDCSRFLFILRGEKYGTFALHYREKEYRRDADLGVSSEATRPTVSFFIEVARRLAPLGQALTFRALSVRRILFPLVIAFQSCPNLDPCLTRAGGCPGALKAAAANHVDVHIRSHGLNCGAMEKDVGNELALARGEAFERIDAIEEVAPAGAVVPLLAVEEVQVTPNFLCK